MTRPPVSDVSELVQSGIASFNHDHARVGFCVRHLPDRPGALSALLADPANADVDELIASAAYGTGYVLSLRSRPDSWSFSRDRSVSAEAHQTEEGVRFVGGGNPNPSFLYEGTEPIDVLVVINPERMSLSRSDGLMLTDVLGAIADHVVSSGLPIMSLQSPVQLPRVSNSSEDRAHRLERWRKPSGFGVRFSAALGRASQGERLVFLDRMRRFCAERGLGLWLGDRRPGYRSGNWFRLLPHATAEFNEYREQFERNGTALSLLLPFTAVGPARVGTTKAVLTALREAGVPIMSASIVALRDTAFIHACVCVHTRQEAINAARASCTVRPIGEALAELAAIGGSGRSVAPAAGVVDRSVAGDYLGMIGGAVTPRFGGVKTERVLWAAWEVPADPRAGQQSTIALVDALRETLRATGQPANGALPSIEYLSVQRSSDDRYGCRAKLAVDSERVLHTAGAGDIRRAVQEFCNEAEHRFRARLLDIDDAGISDCSVGWRESWLGRWTAGGRQTLSWT